ncbi:MAG: leucine-rich repeat protein [Clostridia bacterium]|nr:leucine-rich repeat protein [Clostridia bacterium]
MKKITAILCLTALLFLFASCSSKDSDADDTTIDDKLHQYQSTITSLENQILLLQQNQYVNDSEYQKKLAELTEQLNALKAETDTSADTAAGSSDNIAEISTGFKYIISDNKATITGYDGEDTQIVIPASVDGYRIVAIADGAFENTAVKSIIISDGIETVGWFAFNGCVKLRSVTIPSSVTSIGYSAFGATDSSLTIYCHSDSFALAYAKSYGLSYTVI